MSQDIATDIRNYLAGKPLSNWRDAPTMLRQAAEEIERLRMELEKIADAEGDYEGNVVGSILSRMARDALK